MLYEPNQYMGWNTLVIFWGGHQQKKKNLPSKPSKCKAHPMVRYETTRLSYTVAFWMHDCSDLPLAFTLQTAHTMCRSRTHALWVGSPTPRHRLIKGVSNTADKSTGAWKKERDHKFSEFFHWPSEERLEMSSWLHCDAFWRTKPCFAAWEKET